MKKEKKEKPLVTIVTIAYNIIDQRRDKYLQECFQSIDQQTYENIEHIIVDGASNDGTCELIKKLNRGRKKVKFVSEPDTGIYDAMNKGVNLARGKYIAFLNSDDFYRDENGIRDSVIALEESGAAFSYAAAAIEKENGENLGGMHQYYEPNIKNIFFSMPFCHQTMITRKSVLLKESMFDERFKSAGDYEFLLRLCLKRYKSILVDNRFVTFRLGGYSSTDREISFSEVVKAYQINYGSFADVTADQCFNIFVIGQGHIPFELADKLRICSDYFDYDLYIKSRIERVVGKSMPEKEHDNSVVRNCFDEEPSIIELIIFFKRKTSFVFFSPVKFYRKYYNIFFDKKKIDV